MHPCKKNVFCNWADKWKLIYLIMLKGKIYDMKQPKFSKINYVKHTRRNYSQDIQMYYGRYCSVPVESCHKNCFVLAEFLSRFFPRISPNYIFTYITRKSWKSSTNFDVRFFILLRSFRLFKFHCTVCTQAEPNPASAGGQAEFSSAQRTVESPTQMRLKNPSKL